MRADLKAEIIARNQTDTLEIMTDNRMSPTGYPFKYVRLPGTLSEPGVYQQRRRLCNLGYLLQSHFEPQPDGSVRETYICPAMPPAQYARDRRLCDGDGIAAGNAGRQRQAGETASHCTADSGGYPFSRRCRAAGA
jgi:hypothetical protein